MSMKPESPGRPSGIGPALERILSGRAFSPNVVHVERIDARPARYADWPAAVPERLVDVLQRRGIKQVYRHQAQSIQAALAGENVVVVTPTASGKTLCYNIPIMTAILEDPGARALYLFPTKALSQDQVNELHELVTAVEADIKVFTYDGDTPADARRAIRSVGHVVVSNPDMLHQGILPHHTKWNRLFENLRYVVIDELHAYRGVFGSHLANVLRRLRRVCEFYGSRPVFICASATIANPREHAEALTEQPVTLVDDNGAPAGAKTFVFYNPPVINKELGIRAGSLSSARRIARNFIHSGVQTIVFCGSRLNVEVMTKYLKDLFHGKLKAGDVIRGYRGGYLPNLRREIEQGLRRGEVKGVVSTNALELGIDIGQLDAAVLVGYPGSVASTWQQAGRAGRRKGESVAVLVARSSPLDQFMITHPEYFFGATPEHALISPDNLLVLMAHIRCAAFELPFCDGESFGGEDLEEILQYLSEQKVLHHSAGKWHWMQDAYPANEISLRHAVADNFVVVEKGNKRKILAQVDYSAAAETIYPGAIYMVESKTYHVDELDWDGRQANVRPVETDYYTDAIDYTRIRILDESESRRVNDALVEWGEVHRVKHVPGYKKIKFYSRENVGFGEVRLPDIEMHTTSYWMTLPHRIFGELKITRDQAVDGLLGLGHALHQLAALELMCDHHDIHHSVGDKSSTWFATAGAGRGAPGQFSAPGIWQFGEDSRVLHPLSPDGLDLFEPTLFLYDNHPGGIGFSPKLYDAHETLLTRALETISACVCETGCPSCVGPVGEVGTEGKSVALQLLRRLISAGRA